MEFVATAVELLSQIYLKLMTENTQTIPTNINAIISLSSAILTAISFCIGIAPIPLTGLVCYPVSAVMGIAALATGLVSLRQIRASGEKGRAFALFGAWIGGLTMLAGLCTIVAWILLLPEIAHFIQQIIK